MLQLQNISFGTLEKPTIVKDVSFTICNKKITAITGPNGSGKTTIAKLITGLITPTNGQILLNDQDITQLDITTRANLGISYAFQQPVKMKGIKINELLEIAAPNCTKQQREEVLRKVGLAPKEYWDRELNASLSGGESKRIEIATVLLRNSQCILFDEPEAGIDLWSFQNLMNVFEEIKKDTEAAILIISHQDRILSIADDIIIIEEGSVKEQGPKELMYPKYFNRKEDHR